MALAVQTFYIEIKGDETFWLEMKGYETIGDLKAEIQKQHGFQVDEQRIVFAGKQAGDEQVIKDIVEDAGEVETSRIHMIMELDGGGGAQKTITKRKPQVVRKSEEIVKPTTDIQQGDVGLVTKAIGCNPNVGAWLKSKNLTELISIQKILEGTGNNQQKVINIANEHVQELPRMKDTIEAYWSIHRP